MTLKRRLILTLLSVGLVPVILLAVLSTRDARGVLERQALAQLESVRAIKKEAVVRYLTIIVDQASSLARNQAAVDAMVDFDEGYRLYARESGRSMSSMRSRLLPFYEQEFYPRLLEAHPAVQLDPATLLEPLSLSALAMQYAYIADNPNPTGAKDEMVNPSTFYGYDQAHGKWHPYFRDFQQRFGFYDLFLINNNGDIVYSVFKEIDFATSLIDGPYADSSLGEAYRQATALTPDDDAVLVDFKVYLPSYDAPAGFLAAPMFVNGERVGVLALQFPVDRLGAIMSERSGLGSTGETYLVGSDGLMRSDSLFDMDKHSVVESFRNPDTGRVDTEAVRAGLAGEVGSLIGKDYVGDTALSTYAPIDSAGLNWVLIAEQDRAEAFAPANQLLKSAAWTVAGLVIVVIGVALWTARSILKPLGREPAELQRVAVAIADGDLRASADDQHNASGVFKSMQQMSAGLRALVTRISEAADQQAASSQQLTAITNHTLDNVNRQNEQTEQVATAIEEMSSAINEVTRNTNASAQVAKQTHQVVNQGVDDVGEMVGDINRMADDLRDANTRIQALREEMKGVDAILDTIKGVAEQTNLLALNAAIEAARAGEHGRGFAVVADEVRSLAQNTQNATDEIANTVESLLVSSKQASVLTDECSASAQSIAERSTATAERLRGAVLEVQKIVDLTLQIATASEEQSSVASEVSTSVSRIAAMAAETETAVQEISVSSNGLAELASELQNSVTRFRLD
ncbi:methyl-accepting chemotaxis protein [Saccharospirillum mangrovi]|uniref:methyl-accepting chemotaxis protein n=1 Tax=Saccharospirillum mangrovi TaxID=2161747 RepID=UPI000D3B75E4|nr:methyl-accepting chemotaxis protein [Saccharospirillum mangrovi]